jgi:hypothetical protein
MEGFRRNMVKIIMTWQWANKKPRRPYVEDIEEELQLRSKTCEFLLFLPAEEKSRGIERKKTDSQDIHLEGEATTGEATSSARLAAEGVAACLSEAATTAAVHHVEQDVGIDVDVAGAAAHASHTSHAAHTAHATEAAAASEHVVGIHQVITVIIGGAFPEKAVSYELISNWVVDTY